MLGDFLKTIQPSTNRIDGFNYQEKKISRVLGLFSPLILLLILISFVNTVSANNPLIVYTDQLIEEANILKNKTLDADIPKQHRKKLKNHIKDVINHLQNGRKKLKKGKNKQAKKQFRKARHSVRRYIRTIKRKINKERIEEEVAAPLKADAKQLRRQIRQLIHGQTGNISPIANAGIDQAAQIGQSVMLDGSASSDADGDPLTFYWTIIEQPSGSDVTLSNSDSVTPEFTPDLAGLYIIELVVSDSEGSSTSDSVTVNVESSNTAPVADAGFDQSGHTGDTITLDASASSDAEGDSLNYFWNLATIPSGSNASLNANDSIMPSFVADLPGLYQGELIVNDGIVDSAPDYVDIQIDSLNTPPVANAGPDQSVYMGELVTLDGSASSDVDGDLLNWFWSISSKPTGSTTELDDDGLVQPTFTPDLEGQYVIQLIVDDGEDNSQSDSVIINALKPNTLPIADAGPAQTGYVGDIIQLDASGSSDADNDLLDFDWSLITIPSGSSAVLEYPDSINPSFLLDIPGNYVAQLVVNDGLADSAPDEVVITTINSRPVANPGNDYTILFGETIQLDGSNSSDADGQTLSYSWSIISSPDGSTAGLSDTQSATPSFEPDMIGFYVFQLMVSDGDLDSEPVTVTLQVNAIEELALDLFEPANNHFTNQSEINFRGRLNHSATLTINNEPVTIESDLSFNYVVSLTEGTNSFTLHAIDATLVEVEAVRDVTLDTIVPVTPESESMTISDPDNNGLTTINGQDGSVEPLSTVIVRNLNTQEEVSVLADNLGRFSIQLTVNSSDDYSLFVQDNAGNQSGLISLIEGNTDTLPPDPATVAPELDMTQVTTLYDATAFLFSGSNPIQTGVNPDDIEAKRVVVLRGKVLNRDNSPLPGVTITIKDHPEFGQTLSRDDGQFDLVVNGGGLLTISYQKGGYLAVQRKVKLPWRDYVHSEDAVMIPLDSQVTTIDLTNNQTVQVAQGSIQTDADGSRQATLMFTSGTSAEMILPDGSSQELNTLNVRATEYTVGNNGPNAMPGPLPASSGYTYAVELSVDEAITAGATTVTFNQPVNFYVDNFLDFPVGQIVPVGYYDRDQTAWIPSSNGKIIKIVSHTNGAADISLDPSNVIASQVELDALGITAEELTELANTYAPGTELWRVQVSHFTPWDCNWPFGPPLDAEKHEEEEPETEDEEQPEEPEECEGCIIEVENQVLGERVAITGTPYTLNYRSSRTLGNKTNRTLTIPLSGDTLPASLKAIDVRISIAGQLFQRRYSATTNQTVTWEWNGQDGFGRELNASQVATIRIDYVYNVVYFEASSDSEASFATFGYTDSQIIAERSSSEIKLSRTFQKRLGSFVPTQAGLGLWGVSHHHIYEPVSQTLYLGDGSRRRADIFGNRIITTVVGNGAWGSTGDGGDASQALLDSPEGIAINAAGEIFIADAVNNRVRKIDTNGIITTVAGNGTKGYSGDGGPAVDAALNYPDAIAIASDGTIYIADLYNSRIRKVDTNGIITTVVGTGTRGYSGDGGLAVDAAIANPEGITVGPEGELYIADSENNRIRRVGTDGIISTIAGTGSRSFCGDNGPAINACLAFPRRIAIGPQGELYIADLYNHRIRKISTSGVITTVAGNGSFGFSGDGGLAVNARLYYPADVFVGQEGELYIVDKSNRRIREVGTDGVIKTIIGNGTVGYTGDGGLATEAGFRIPVGIVANKAGEFYIADYSDQRIRKVLSVWKNFSHDDFTITSSDGNQLFHFDATGRHIRTLNTTTGEVLYRFAYSGSGQLESITDVNGHVTQIQRDENGNPLSIVAPYGQVTTLALDVNGYLAEIIDPLSNRHQMNYDSDGLMIGYSNPNNANSSYHYDSLGRLVLDINPENGGWTLNRSDSDNGYNVTMTSAENRATLFQVDLLNTGDNRRQITTPDGLLTEHLTKTNGEKITTQPNGTVITTKVGPDPRFSLLAPVTTDTSIRTPSGLQLSASQAREAILADENDPLSVTSLTKTSYVNNRSSVVQYDSTTQTWTNTSASNRTNIVQINSQGKPILSQVTGLEATNFGYDSHGRINIISEGSGSELRSNQFNYYQNGAMNGYLQSITNAENQITYFEYDAVGRVTKQILPDTREILYTYDANGNLTSLTPPGRIAHVFNYDDLDQSTQYTPPTVNGITNPETTYSYNRDKQLTQITRPDGQEITLTYGTISGKLDSINIPSGSISYAYDSGTGQLVSITAPDNGILNFSYDGFLNTQTQWSGEVSGIIAQTYNNDFKVVARTINGEYNVDFQYDNDNLLTQAGSLTISRETQKGGLINGTSLDNLNTSMAYNGFAELMSFNAAFNAANLYSTSYSRDKLGRITQKVETIGGVNSTTNYQYDSAGRLISETRDNNTVTYTYDTNGNRTHINGTLVGTYDEQDRLINYASTEYQYTANGELQAKVEAGQSTLYNYDVFGNLKQVTFNDGTVIDYIVDGRNRRIGKKVDGALVQGFLYKDQLNPIAELDGNNQIIARFVYGSKTNVPDFIIKNGITYRIISDHLGSPRLIVDASNGNVVQRIDYDTWGSIINDTNPGFQPFGFAGGLYDRQTQFTRFGARDYEAWIGRWTVKDPIGFYGGDANLFSYVASDPINFYDPYGLSSTLGGNNPGFSDPVERQKQIDEAKRILNDPNSSQKDKSKAKRNLRELMRKPSKAAQHHGKQGGYVMPGVFSAGTRFIGGIGLLMWPNDIGCADLDCDHDGIPDMLQDRSHLYMLCGP